MIEILFKMILTKNMNSSFFNLSYQFEKFELKIIYTRNASTQKKTFHSSPFLFLYS